VDEPGALHLDGGAVGDGEAAAVRDGPYELAGAEAKGDLRDLEADLRPVDADPRRARPEDARDRYPAQDAEPSAAGHVGERDCDHVRPAVGRDVGEDAHRVPDLLGAHAVGERPEGEQVDAVEQGRELADAREVAGTTSVCDRGEPRCGDGAVGEDAHEGAPQRRPRECVTPRWSSVRATTVSTRSSMDRGFV